MFNVEQIIEGTLNNVFNKEEELFNNRIKICRCCKLHKIDNIFGEVCNPRLYINPETEEISSSKKPGYIHGCGCILASKCRVPDAKCPMNKW